MLRKEFRVDSWAWFILACLLPCLSRCRRQRSHTPVFAFEFWYRKTNTRSIRGEWNLITSGYLFHQRTCFASFISAAFIVSLWSQLSVWVCVYYWQATFLCYICFDNWSKHSMIDRYDFPMSRLYFLLHKDIVMHIFISKVD